MTAVFKNPLSITRRPRSVSFSARSPSFAGAFICLKAVAGIALFSILVPPTPPRGTVASKGERREEIRKGFVELGNAVQLPHTRLDYVRDGIGLARSVVRDGERVGGLALFSEDHG